MPRISADTAFPRFDALLLPELKSRDSMEDRKQYLHETLRGVREENVDMEALFDALVEAKQRSLAAKVEGHQIDFEREFAVDRQKALAGSKNVRRFLIRYLVHDKGTEEEDRRVRLLDELAQLLEKFPRSSGSLRRTRIGRQREPWINDARRKLRRLKVPNDLAEQLLNCVGLVK